MEKIKRKHGTSYREKVYWVDGSTRTKTFKRKTDAQAWKRKQLHERDQAFATGVVIRDDMLFSDFVDKWMREKVVTRLAPATQAKYLADLRNHILPILRNYRLRDIKLEHGNQIIKVLRDSNHFPSAINNILGILKGILNDAVRWEYLIKSPLHNLKAVQKEPSRIVFWSRSEIDRFLRQNIMDPLYGLYVLALNTGMRRGEIAALQWDRISLDRKSIDVTRSLSKFGLRETTKTGERRTIPMNETVQKLLSKAWKEQNGSFIFGRGNGIPLDTNHLYRRFSRAQKRAGITNIIRFHDLRHTFASHFMMNGGNIYDLQKILGHKNIDMTQRYAHLSPLHLEKAIQVINFESFSPDLAHEKVKELKVLGVSVS